MHARCMQKWQQTRLHGSLELQGPNHIRALRPTHCQSPLAAASRACTHASTSTSASAASRGRSAHAPISSSSASAAVPAGPPQALRRTAASRHPNGFSLRQIAVRAGTARRELTARAQQAPLACQQRIACACLPAGQARRTACTAIVLRPCQANVTGDSVSKHTSWRPDSP